MYPFLRIAPLTRRQKHYAYKKELALPRDGTKLQSVRAWPGNGTVSESCLMRTHGRRERMCNSSIVQVPIIVTLFSISDIGEPVDP